MSSRELALVADAHHEPGPVPVDFDAASYRRSQPAPAAGQTIGPAVGFPGLLESAAGRG